MAIAIALLGAVILFVLYIRHNDRRLRKIPARIESLSKRTTPEFIRADAMQYFGQPQKDIKGQLPERTGRRYIVVGGVSV
jgi:hypothetical protein